MTIAFMEKQLYFILLPGSGAEPLEIPRSNDLLQNPLPRLIQPGTIALGTRSIALGTPNFELEPRSEMPNLVVLPASNPRSPDSELEKNPCDDCDADFCTEMAKLRSHERMSFKPERQMICIEDISGHRC
jgi:hypothetical protein